MSSSVFADIFVESNSNVCGENLTYSGKKCSLRIWNSDAIPVDTLLAGLWKAANPGAPFIFLGSDWLKRGNKEDYGC